MSTACTTEPLTFHGVAGRQVVARVDGGALTSDGGAVLRTLYEVVYGARGELEHRIKEQQLGLFADRTSAATFRAHQLRLYCSTVAYVLLAALRRLGLAGTALAKAQCTTIRLTLLKVGARIRVTVRNVWLALANGCPHAGSSRRCTQMHRCPTRAKSCAESAPRIMPIPDAGPRRDPVTSIPLEKPARRRAASATAVRSGHREGQTLAIFTEQDPQPPRARRDRLISRTGEKFGLAAYMNDSARRMLT